jgi:MFS family permease
MLYGLDTTIAADVQGAVVERFDHVQQLAWIGAGFPLGSVSCILAVGHAYGRFELKTMFIAYLVIFEAGSALCGAAPNMPALITGRVIAGVGGAGIYLGALNLFTVFTTMQERPLYMGLIGMFWGLGTILGPVVGGLFSDNSPTWRWVSNPLLNLSNGSPFILISCLRVFSLQSTSSYYLSINLNRVFHS